MTFSVLGLYVIDCVMNLILEVCVRYMYVRYM